MLIPKTKDRHVGVEIECISLVDEGVFKEDINKAQLNEFVCVGSDGSIEDDDLDDEEWYGYEFKVCATHNQLPEVLSKLCKILRKNKCYVNDTCGLHVHLDARNDNPRVMWARLHDTQDVLFSMVESERLYNEYCEPLTREDDYHRADNHYCSISSSSVKKHNTIEVRLHHGTIKYREILSFIKLLIAIAYPKNKLVEEIKGDRVKEVVKEYALSKSLERVIRNAMKKQGREKVLEVE